MAREDAEDREPQHGRCPSCGQITNAKPGTPVAPHQKPDGSRETCPGGTAQ